MGQDEGHRGRSKTTKVGFGGEGVLKSHFPQNLYNNIFHIKMKNFFFFRFSKNFQCLKYFFLQCFFFFQNGVKG